MTDRDTTITVAVSDTLPSLLSRISANGGAIRLVIPLGSSLFFTANEFQALKSVAEMNGRTLTVATDDPLRQHLASMFDLPFVGEEEGLQLEPPKAEGAEPASPQIADATEPNQHPAWTAVAAPVAATTTTETTSTSEPKAEFKESQAKPDASPVSSSSPPSRFGNRRKIFGIAGAVVAVAIVIGLAVAIFLVPRATVAVHLKETPVSSSIIFGISTDPSAVQSGSEMTITGGTVEADVTIESSAPVTGQKSVPDKTASGKVVFSNPTTKEVTLDKGTKLTGDVGAVFLLDDRIKAPAGKPGAPGLIEGKVTSAEPGTKGNLKQGELSGKLDSGVYFSNRNEAMQGGTDRAVQVVSAADLEAAQKAADSQLSEAAATALDDALTSGHKIVESSIAAGTTDYTFDHQEGDEASTINATARTHVTALDYDESDLRAQLTGALTPKLADAAPNGYELAPDTIQIGELALVQDLPHGAEYRVTADASAVAKFTGEDQQQLADQLVRKSNSSATTLLRGVGAIDSFSIDYKPALLPDRMPSNANRIDFEIDNAP
jgi:hypothetical protein